MAVDVKYELTADQLTLLTGHWSDADHRRLAELLGDGAKPPYDAELVASARPEAFRFGEDCDCLHCDRWHSLYEIHYADENMFADAASCVRDGGTHYECDSFSYENIMQSCNVEYHGVAISKSMVRFVALCRRGKWHAFGLCDSCFEVFVTSPATTPVWIRG